MMYSRTETHTPLCHYRLYALFLLVARRLMCRHCCRRSMMPIGTERSVHNSIWNKDSTHIFDSSRASPTVWLPLQHRPRHFRRRHHRRRSQMSNCYQHKAVIERPFSVVEKQWKKKWTFIMLGDYIPFASNFLYGLSQFCEEWLNLYKIVV